MMMRTPLLSLAAVAALAVACSTSPRESFEPEPAPPPGLSSVDAGPPPDGGRNCVSEEKKAEPVPLAMLVLIDRSGSMSGDKWDSATKAIRAFADRAEVVGMKMGVQFFPPLGSGDQCNASLYANPAVPIAPLPDNVLPIQQKLASTAADGGATPMRSGLEGSIAAMRSFIESGPPHQGVVILVTDGDPNSCGNVSNVASVAASGANPLPGSGVPRVLTFAVGMEGASFSNLDQIAAAGGGGKSSFNVGAGAAAQQALVDALESVRAGVIGCEYVLPVPPPGEGVLDYDSVEILFTPGTNDPQQTIRRVPDKATCGATSGGYYYDDPENPTRVILCPASCTAVQGATAAAEVDLHFGCIQKPN